MLLFSLPMTIVTASLNQEYMEHKARVEARMIAKKLAEAEGRDKENAKKSDQGAKLDNVLLSIPMINKIRTKFYKNDQISPPLIPIKSNIIKETSSDQTASASIRSEAVIDQRLDQTSHSSDKQIEIPPHHSRHANHHNNNSHHHHHHHHHYDQFQHHSLSSDHEHDNNESNVKEDTSKFSLSPNRIKNDKSETTNDHKKEARTTYTTMDANIAFLVSTLTEMAQTIKNLDKGNQELHARIQRIENRLIRDKSRFEDDSNSSMTSQSQGNSKSEDQSDNGSNQKLSEEPAMQSNGQINDILPSIDIPGSFKIKSSIKAND